ncbi:hypothetical protein LAZ67_11002372 [Cordylochernes scorpioides]|uniref:Uncharacterized protein n=1 Tax=Cordylochernes scorpioides TaxID=51811 RepID=A0ABY6L1I4_9ARAC|nr:hypothetical protein LAZ67_11002372 [Cordylochernes scorpioides]
MVTGFYTMTMPALTQRTWDDIIEKSLLALKSIPKEAYKNCFDNWEKRWRWCVEARGITLKIAEIPSGTDKHLEQEISELRPSIETTRPSEKFTTGRKPRWNSYTPGSTEPNNLQVRRMSSGHRIHRA